MPASLHTHSWYSLLEGVSSPTALIERAAALGYDALALTDTNNLYGAVAFSDAAHACGIRPLLGACLRHNRERCVALAADPNGYRNLCRILSRLHLGTGEPFSLAELLTSWPDGLHVLADDPALAERLRDAFGSRLWLEVIRPPRSPKHEQELLAFARRSGLRLVASTAVHLATPDEYPTFRLVAAVRQTTLLERIPRRLTVGPEHHLVDLTTLRARFRDLPEALRSADALAEQLRSDVLPRDLILPRPKLRPGLEEERYLRRLCERGLRRRDLGGSLGARQRLREELALIEAAEMAGYFLVVRDIARHARRRGHSMALRGSAGNSLVCYLLGITDVNPLRFGLSLERFLHPGRRDLPDIDLDFDWKVRDEVIAYARRRFGERTTAQISSHLFLQPRSAFREAAKAHGLSDEQIGTLIDSLSERVERLVLSPSPLGGEGEPGAVAHRAPRTRNGDVAPHRFAFASPDSQMVPPPPAPRSFPLEAERWPRLLADARRLLGRPHHLSIHPGGIVITPRPIDEYVPLQRAPKGVTITQYDKDAVERIGLVKIDLLGNRALATVDEARRWLRVLPPVAPPADEEAVVLDMLRRGDTLGVNQLESPAVRHLLVQMQPRGLEDVVQALALIRPGAASLGSKETFLRRRRGLEPVRPLHPLLEPLLRDTEGVMLYEDDALKAIQALTGLDTAAADRFRKRVSKHSTAAEARRLADEFLAACAHRGVARAVAEEVWVQLAKFNQYSFCKSHAVSYGLIAWQAAALKARHPLAFWTAALNNNQGMYPRRVYIEALKRAGLVVELPCVNRSEDTFAIDNDCIRTGLGAIASLDEATREAILSERRRNGPFTDLADFRRRVAPTPEALTLLIRCGALDFTGRPRAALFLEVDLTLKSEVKRTKDEGHQAQGDLPFDLGPLSFVLPGEPSWVPRDDAERRRRDEWELLGFVVGEPMMAMFRSRLPRGLVSSREVPKYVGRRVRVAGLVAAARQTTTLDGRPMQFITLEDEHGLVEVTLFPGACPLIPYLTLGPYLVAGTVEDHHGVASVAATRVQKLDV